MSKIAFIGGGNMASCIFNGIVKSRAELDQITVSGPHVEKLEKFKQQGASISTDNVANAKQAEVIFLGVKPQILTSVLQQLAENQVDFKSKLLISMAAGFTCKSIAKYTASHRIIRIMPNTPANLGLGVIGFYHDQDAGTADIKLAMSLLNSLGLIIPAETEEQINVIGAVAGCAPAFFYRFMQALAAEAQLHGFSEQASRKMVEQVALGSASMALNCQDQSLTDLREAVTSKGGTTFEGLKVMSAYKFEEMMHEVINAALKRTYEFEKLF